MSLQREHAQEVTAAKAAGADLACDICGVPGSELAWFYFRSPPETWKHLVGRAGMIAYCDRDERQVGFTVTVMN